MRIYHYFIATAILCIQLKTFSQTNVALGKPATADSEYSTSYIAANAVDGDYWSDASRWMTTNTPFPHWIEIDLQGTFSITQVQYWTGYSGYNSPITDYQIQYWDGSSWVDIVNVTGNSNAEVDHTFSAIATNKVKLLGTAATNNYIKCFEIEVYGTGIPVTGVSVSPASLSLDEGQSSDLTETVSPSGALDKSVAWSSDDTDIATVDANGLVTAVKPGTATITVTTNDGGFTDDCNVTVNCPVLAVPGNFYATKGDGAVTLIWDAVAGADGYNINYSTTQGQAINGTLVYVDGALSFKEITGLTNETTYYFVITAIYDICEGDASAEVSATPSSFIDEYIGPNVYISTVGSGQNLGAGFSATRINGVPNGFTGNLVPLDFVIDITAPNADDNLDACLTFSYAAEVLPEGMNLATFDLYRFDENAGKWEKMGGILNMNERTVKLCNINEFSQWTLAGSAPESVPLGNWGIGVLIFLLAISIYLNRRK